MSFYPVAKAGFFYLESNIRRLVHGSVEVIFPKITSEDHGILIATSDISKALAGKLVGINIRNDRLHVVTRNIYDAIECLNTVNEFVEATNRKRNITIPHYEADLSGLVLIYGRHEDVRLESVIAGNELRRSIEIRAHGWGLGSSDDKTIKDSLSESGLNNSGLSLGEKSNRSLVIDLGSNPLDTTPICTLVNVFNEHTRSPIDAIKIFSKYLTPILDRIRGHLEIEADARELSGRLLAAQPLGKVSDVELGKVKE